MAKAAKKTKKERKPTRIEIFVRENPSRAVMIALAVLCVIRIGIFLSETNPPDEPPAPPTPWTMPTPIEFKKQLVELIKPKKPFEESEFRELASANIFDPKQVLDSRTAVGEAEVLYSQADATFKVYQESKKNENLMAAKRLVDDALLKLPSHFYARHLRDKINEELGIVTAAEKAKQIAEKANKPTTGTATAVNPPPAASPEAQP